MKATRKITVKPKTEPEPANDFDFEPEKEPETPPVQVQEPEPVRQPVHESVSRSTGITKSQAIRDAIAAGFDKPQAGSAWIKEQYNIQVTPQMFSTVKNTSRKQGSTHIVRRPAPAPIHTRPLTGVTRSLSAMKQNPESSLDLAREVKRLISTYGTDAVSEMVSLFSE